MEHESMTTASTAQNLSFRENRLVQVLSVLLLGALAASGYRPVMVADWWLENGLVFLFLAFLIASYRRLALSQLSYLLIFVYLCLHEWGAHYRYALDPFGEWMKQFQSTTRNQFDRWVHLSFGLLMYYPLREALIRRARLRGAWALWIPALLLLGYGAGYELVEAFAAAVLSPETAEAFLSLQGDPWDTHKDMFMALAGATVAMTVTAVASRVRAGQRAKLKAVPEVKAARARTG